MFTLYITVDKVIFDLHLYLIIFSVPARTVYSCPAVNLGQMILALLQRF